MGQTLEKLENYFENIGEKKFKATQVYDWLYKKKVSSFDEMTNIKKDVIVKLKEDFKIDKPQIIAKQTGRDVYKYLFELADGNKVEAVLMIHDYGISLCVSTQVGCNMGCIFCESGRLKKVRNLETSEMVGQVMEVERDSRLKITHIVNHGNR